MKTVIFDRDGTLSSCEWRVRKYLRSPLAKDKTNWTAFFDALELDEPIPQTLQLARMLHVNNYNLVLWTGIPSRYGGSLGRWLDRNGLNIFSEIRMREAKDFRKDIEMKRAWLESLKREERNSIFLAVENDDEISQMYTRNGVQTFLVRDINANHFAI